MKPFGSSRLSVFWEKYGLPVGMSTVGQNPLEGLADWAS